VAKKAPQPIKWSQVPIELARLAQAVATRVRDLGGTLTKTKLLKYFYLFDIATYRHTRAQFTDFQWIFYKYGPWARAFEPAYDRWQGVFIDVRNSGDAQIVLPREPLDLERVVDDIGLQMEFGNIIREWANAPLGEMLNYVYFETEPMQDAQREQPLDFSKIMRDVERPLRRLPAHDADPAAVRAARERIAAAKQARVVTGQPLVPPPDYDEAYWTARAASDDDDDDR
jgi:hypothetical protein